MTRNVLLLVTLLGTVWVLSSLPNGLRAQEQAQKWYLVGGERHGVSFLPRVDYPETRPLQPGVMDFKHYHTYDETNAFLKKWAEQYPNLVDLYVVAKSFEGRDIWQMTITNKSTGKHTDKPAFFIEGGRHSGEITGTESALWFANHLFESYGKDPEITQLVDTKTIYFKPINNPDGSELYRHTAQRNRSSNRPYDEDLDGLLDEDAGDDLDEDGFLRQMRVKVGMGKGTHVVDPKDSSGRLMKEVGAGKGDYLVYSEGLDNDGDGRYNEDGIGGLDLHRNYPENWHPNPGEDATGRGYTQSGAGEYPTSEPETRAVVLWVLKHPNIAVAQTMDTVVPMILHGPSTHKPEEGMRPEDIKLYNHFDEQGKKITGYPNAGDAYYAMANRDRRPGEPEQVSFRFGHSLEFGYYQFGAIWYGDELWCEGRMKDYDGDGFMDPWEVLRWNDEALGGRGFKNWAPYNHPQLGQVEIGGFNPKFFSQNPPTELLEEWARKEAMFNFYLAKSLPQVKIVSAAAKPVSGQADTFDITLTCTNEGFLPTALEQAKIVKAVRPDTVTIEPGQNVQLVEGARAVEVGSLASKETKSHTWRVKKTTPGSQTVTVSILSTRGGVASQQVNVP